ncbi:DUF4493 domain-containing protein [Phocaeicola plebeius]|jgi:hypothetical protein|uniref:DUF4493 domain-containing protein n=1 Tax=Phocaeicola plebeius TaxID=310297 RepID=UPI0026F12785|nr:DUF4493 domain-containing protein [Phocaeicola plebeius]
MKKVYYGLLSFFFVGLVSCTKDEPQSSLEGRIDVKVSTDQTLLGEASRSGEEKTIPDINDFGLTIESLDGKVFNSWESFSEFRPVSVAIGTYTVTASYGDVEAEGFDAISYQGSTNVEVRKEETAEASVTCIINKAKVSINYTDEFKSYFTSYSSYISSSKGNKVTFSANESQGAYFVPGSLGVYLEVTRQGVSQKVTLNPKNFTAEAKHEYRLTMDVDASTASLKITFNDNPSSEQNVEINISDEALNADPPVFTPYGFTSGNTLEVLEGAAFTEKLEAYLNAPAGLAKCELVTNSASLKEQGWPESVDLMNLTTEQSQKMTALGLQTKGLGVNHDKIALIDFQQLVPNLTCTSENNEVHTFTLRATDALTKVSEELKLVIETRNNGFAVELPETVPYASTSVTFTLTLEGDVSKVKFYYDLSDTGVYQPFSAEKVQITGENTKHTVTLTYPESLTDTEHDVKLKAEFGVKVIEKSFKIEDPELTLSLKNGNADVWATKAYVQVVASAKARTLRTISSSTVEIQYKEGEKWKAWPHQSYDEKTGLFLLTGMGDGATEESGVEYTLRAAYKRNGEPSAYSEDLQILTEAKAQVGNRGFEDWYSEALYSQNILWAKNTIYNYYFWKENQDVSLRWWDTCNNKTTPNPGGGSVWDYRSAAGVVPTSDEQNTASYHLRTYDGKSELKTEGHTGNAAEIATVGWGSDNLWVNDGATAKNKTAGTLYIGTYGEPINYGKSFASRPLGVKFWYKYYSYNNETTTPYVEVYGDNQEVIGSGSLLINASNYEFKSGYIPIDYPVAKKAKSITIVFSSTDSKNPETKAVQGDAGDFSGNLDSRHIGSILTVDDVELIYE